MMQCKIGFVKREEAIEEGMVIDMMLPNYQHIQECAHNEETVDLSSTKMTTFQFYSIISYVAHILQHICSNFPTFHPILTTSIHRPPTRQPPFRIPDLHPLHFKCSNMSYAFSSQDNPFKSIQIRVTSNACFIASFSKWVLRIRGNHGDPRHLSSSYERD